MYSTGLPILYPFAALQYVVLYWVQKGLIIKFYERTSSFNEELPMMSTRFIKFGLVFHAVMGGLMLTNSDLMPETEKYQVDVGSEVIQHIGREFLSRLVSRPYSAMYLGFWLVILIFIVAKNTVLKIVIKLFGFVISKTCF